MPKKIKDHETRFWRKLATQARRFWTYYDKNRKRAINRAWDTTEKRLLCAGCGLSHQPEYCHVDHIKPIGSLPNTRVEFNRWIQKLKCPMKNLQILCVDCHKQKTNRERAAKRKGRTSG